MELESIGSYRVVEVVAVDRQTITVRAQRGREPTVLIKTTKPGHLNAASAARALEREADFLLAHRHDAWPTVLEVLRDGPSMAVVLLDRRGHRLDAVLDRAGPLDTSAALAVAIEVAQAIGALHRAGVAHGALHAGLVELTAEGGVCVHAAQAATDGPGELSAPEHMAPEQLLGDPPDSRSDLFLVGALLFHMLTGREPFAGEDEGVSMRVRHHAPPPMGRFVAGVPVPVEAIVSRCLSKKRHDRVPDAASLVARLTRELRRETSLSSEALVVRALARAGLAEAWPAPLESGADRGTAVPAAVARRRWLALGVVALLFVFGAVLWIAFSGDASPGAIGPRGILEEPGRIRVLARPWAEVAVDGERIDVTPLGAPLEVSPGRHTVVLRHPAAPEVSRVVEVSAGQTALVDVDMEVVLVPRTAPSAAASGSASPESP